MGKPLDIPEQFLKVTHGDVTLNKISGLGNDDTVYLIFNVQLSNMRMLRPLSY